MKALHLLIISLLTSLSSAARAQSQAPKSKDAILLSKVSTLTLKANALTAGRRSKPIPQLTCDGPACSFHTIDTMRCTNAGTGYGEEDIQWTCTVEVPSAFKLGSTDVQCEGFRSSDDDYVLRGSCGVTYRLLFTDAGEAEYAEQIRHHQHQRKTTYNGSQENPVSKYVFMLLFVGVLGWILYSACLRAGESRRGGGASRPRRRRGGGGWGGHDGDDDDAPPPYTPRPGPRYTKSDPMSSPRTAGRGQAAGWGFGNPGFWTGALGGAAAGYAAASRRRGNDRATGEGMFGGGGPFRGGGSSAGPSFASSSSSSSGGRRYESTGFGGTSRR